MPTPYSFARAAAGLFFLLWSLGLGAQPRLVKDANPLTVTYNALIPSHLGAANGRLYFSGHTPEHGAELWQSDGTETGTRLVRDLAAGSRNSYPAEFTPLNGVVYFPGFDLSYGRELWQTDGTEAGTVRVKDIYPGAQSGLDTSPASWLTPIGNTLFFVADDGVTGVELWKSDGTEAGTVLVKDIRAGSLGANPTNLVAWNGTLYFAATDATSGTELWKSDGTAAGTVRVKDINPGANHSLTWYPLSLVPAGNHLFFCADNGVHGRELWKTDGTEAGTVLVADLLPGSWGATPDQITHINGTLFFAAFTDNAGVELWKSDGRAAGTVLVSNINPGTGSAGPEQLTAVGNTLYFVATDGVRGKELWRTDGTAAGTALVRDIHPDNNTYAYPVSLTAGNGRLFFGVINNTPNNGLWVSDGTESGTLRILEKNPTNLTRLGDAMFFAAGVDDGRDIELWKSDGTPAGTTVVKASAGVTTMPAHPRHLTPANGALYFTADNGTTGRELWRTDGTAEGTRLVKDIFAGGIAAFPADSPGLFHLNGTLYLGAYHAETGVELWKSDGTEAGTVLVKDIRPGPVGVSPVNFAALGNEVYFVANDGNTGRELWKSDGTAAGTVRVKDINPGPANANPGQLFAVNGALYFIAEDALHGRELWRSDGTEAGTVLVKDIRPGVSGGFSLSVIGLTPVGNVLYFAAEDGVNGTELWRSDGTEAGTRMVKNIRSGSDSGFGATNYHTYFANVGGTLYFAADDNSTGAELWKSDGTEAGTVRVKDIRPGFTSTFGGTNHFFTAVNDVLFFMADDGVSGKELWKSDGTAAGTVRISDVYPDRGHGSPKHLTNVNGTLLFTAYNNENGTELWQSDGTAAGTRLVKDLRRDGGAFPFEADAFLAASDGVLYFAADDGVAGEELWRYQPVACPVPDPSLAVAGDTVCPAQAATLTVKSTQAGVAYRVYRENVPVGEPRPGGGDLAFPIPASSLAAGANVLGVRATGCTEVPLTQTATVWVLAGADAPLVKDTTITAGQAVTLTAAGAPSGATYRWYTQATDGVPVATGPAFTTPVLAADTAYYVSGYRADCFESARTKVTVTVKPAVVSGVEPAGATGRLVVSPNPAGGLLHVVFPVPLQSPATVRLYGATCKPLREVQPAAGARACTLDVSALPAGIYSLQVRTAREKWARKVVKQ